MIETHPFAPFIPVSATHIILGSFPTHKKNWRFNFYYPGRSNFFWRMLSEIYRHPFEHILGYKAVEERVALCTEKGISFSDTIYKCRRKVSTSSRDDNLVEVEKMNILQILRQHSSIRSVILTGSSGAVSAHKIFFEHLHENKIPVEVMTGKPPAHGWFLFNGRKITTHTLYSTSGINIGRYKRTVEQYRECLPWVEIWFLKNFSCVLSYYRCTLYSHKSFSTWIQKLFLHCLWLWLRWLDFFSFRIWN